MNSKSFEKILSESLAIRDLLTQLSWNEEDMKVLPKRYTSVMVHIALERADMDKKFEYFKRILNKNRVLLSLHVEMSNGCLHWNYLGKVRGELSPLQGGGIMTLDMFKRM